MDIIQSLKTILGRILILLIVFYYIYPQALDVRGSSFISMSGIIGIIVYALHKFPFKEVFHLLLFFGAYIAVCLLASYLSDNSDDYYISFIRSQMAWFFTAYLIMFLIFKLHSTPKFETLLIYIIGAIALQCAVTLIMYFNKEANDFFFSLQLQAEIDETKKEMAGEYRLIGYGTGFFGAGIVAGYGLMLIPYLILKIKMNSAQYLLTAATYTFIFLIGLFSARTTVVGAGLSIVIFAIIYFFDNKPYRRQGGIFLISLIILLAVGVSLCFIYFPEYTDWAFELFTKAKSGQGFQTDSSNGLYGMFYAPEDFRTFLIGNGSMKFFGSDVGFTRLWFHSGLIGMAIYFLYGLFIVKKSWTKDWVINFLILMIVVDGLLMNVKGLTDLNMVLYLFFFYFMFHKYYVFYPQIRLKNHNSLIGTQQ